MDTYEENEQLSQPQEEVIPPSQPEDLPQPPQEEILPQVEDSQLTEEQTDGYYHGVGTGTRETTFVITDPEFSREETAPAQPVRRRRRKKGLGKKILKCSVASVLIIALVAAACGISIVVTNTHWKVYNQLLQQNFDQQIQVLRQELEEYKQREDAPLIAVPTEGLLPSQIYQQNIRSVVAVNCVVRTTENGKAYEGESAGSGFVLTQDGYIVTNHHVVSGSTSISVTFVDGQQQKAQLIGSDAINDIALLKIVAENLQPVVIGSSADLREGDQVVAIGNALGELSFSLTVGYVSGTDRSIATDGSITTMIQTDASINSGNSGGPLFNSRGEVVGITTAKYSGLSASGASIEGIGFALPIDNVIGMLHDLRQYGYITGAYMGVMVQDVDPEAAERYGFPRGAYVAEPTPGYAAEKAGILPKDIITNVGGYDITCMSDLTRVLRNFKAGDETTVVVWRSGQKIVLPIVFDEKPRG